MGHHNLSDCSFLDCDQKPLEAGAIIVESGTHVGEDFEVWVDGLERLDLPLEIIFLFSGGHSRVQGSGFRFLPCLVIALMDDELVRWVEASKPPTVRAKLILPRSPQLRNVD
jgi:hypothetical protein